MKESQKTSSALEDVVDLTAENSPIGRPLTAVSANEEYVHSLGFILGVFMS